MEYELTKVELVKLISLLKNNKKAQTVNTLHNLANVSKDVVILFLSSIEKLDYLKLLKSPSGRFINFKFTPFSKHIYYSDNYSCIIEQGKVTYGVYRSFKKYSDANSFQRKLTELPDLAKNNNALYVYGDLTTEQLCDEILKLNNIIQSQLTASDLLTGYPYLEEEIKRLENKKSALEAEIQQEIDLNQKNQKWYEEETARAKNGDRYIIQQKRGRYLGKKTIHGPSYQVKDSEWNGGNTYWHNDTIEVDEYEVIPYKVPDFPKKREMIHTKQVENQPRIDSINYKISELCTYPIKYEKILSELNNHEKEIRTLENEKQKIEHKLRLLSNSKQSILSQFDVD